MPTVADLIVRLLGEAGVRTLFGVPGGGSNLDLVAAAGRAGLPFVLTSTETAAALSAIAQAEITGHTGACLTTHGPGAASVVNGVACALLDRVPLVVFTDSHPTAAAGKFAHQRLDQAALMGSITKSSGTITAANASQVIACAIRTATTPPQGPVHLECPGDVASVEGLPSLQGHASPRSDPPTVASALEMLAQARRPLLLVGLGARRREDAIAIRRLCESRGVPAMVTYKAKGVVPDGHPWFAGVFTNAAIEQSIIDESDLLIGIGLDPVELLPRPWRFTQRSLYVGPWMVEDRHVPFVDRMVMDIPVALERIGEALTESAWDSSRLRALVADQRARLAIATERLAPHRVVEIAARLLAARVGRVTVDAGAHMLPATMLWPVDEPNHLLISNGLSTMGFALPAAIGAALLDRSRPVVALTGDGGLLMCVGELLTAARLKVRTIVLVFSDASLSLIEIKQQARQLPADGVSLGVIDWPALASSFGVPAWRASTEAELERAIGRAAECDGPSLIEAKIDRSNYGAVIRTVRGRI